MTEVLGFNDKLRLSFFKIETNPSRECDAK